MSSSLRDVGASLSCWNEKQSEQEQGHGTSNRLQEAISVIRVKDSNSIVGKTTLLQGLYLLRLKIRVKMIQVVKKDIGDGGKQAILKAAWVRYTFTTRHNRPRGQTLINLPW